MAHSDGSMIDWYRGKTIFVTGGTGFMGKVLLEKLLRSCPGIKTIYFLCRAKKGLSPQGRVAEFSKLAVFDKLRQSNPEALQKLVAIEGDLTTDGLGISEANRKRLQDEVNVVFSLAASVRLECGLKSAIEQNTKGTLRILKLCEEMKNLKSFVHLSTAFCHCEQEVLEEKLYPTPVDPDDIIKALEWMSEDSIELITPKLIDPHPNCYTFSKRLAETLVQRYAGKLPVSVARPSIVTPSIYEPVPGWVDNLNGPVGVIIGAGKGIIRSMLCDPNNRAEVIPVDIAINALIVIGWRRAVETIPEGEVPVYNLSIADRVTVTWGYVVEKGRQIISEYPYEPGLWCPSGKPRTNPYTHALVVFFLQLVPAYLIDFILMCIGRKKFMVRLQERIAHGMKVLRYFTMRAWCFKIDKARSLTNTLNDEEKKIFYVDNTEYDIDEYIKNFIIGSRTYCLREPISSLERSRKQMKWLYILDKVTQVVFIYLCYCLILKIITFGQFLTTFSSSAFTLARSSWISAQN